MQLLHLLSYYLLYLFQIDVDYICSTPSLLHPDPIMATKTPQSNTLFKVDVKYGPLGYTHKMVAFKVRL